MRLNVVPEKMIKARIAERGNALLIIFIAIAVLGILTYSVSQSNEVPTSMSDNAARDDQIARMFTYAGTLGGALNQMVAAGVRAEDLYSTLNTVLPSSVAAFAAAPHNTKIYHPMGGGVSYVSSSGASTAASTVATSYRINKGSIVADVGPTDAVIGDILFTARIDSALSCQRINYLIRGSTSVPVLATASFNNLFTNGATVTINAANCASCVSLAQSCVSNTAGTAWGYYSVLFPG